MKIQKNLIIQMKIQDLKFVLLPYLNKKFSNKAKSFFLNLNTKVAFADNKNYGESPI